MTDTPTLADDRSNWPTAPGYYWATLRSPSGMPGGEEWVSGRREIVEVNDNNGEGDEAFSVQVFGIPVTQWPANFEWHGPLSRPTEARTGGDALLQEVVEGETWGPAIYAGKGRPDFVRDDDLTMRRLPLGPSIRKASGIATWCGPAVTWKYFHLLADHPAYALSNPTPADDARDHSDTIAVRMGAQFVAKADDARTPDYVVERATKAITKIWDGDEGFGPRDLAVAALTASGDARERAWQTIESAPQCELHPYDTRGRKEDRYVLLWNGFHVGVGYFLIDDSDPENGGFWCSEDEQFISPEPTHWMEMPKPPALLNTPTAEEEGK